ncbi:MAG: thioredoxin family protein [Methanotrichaceae archaeon]|nr:thioredoxin family protein [Methanotrichaceae archaeon]
MFGSVTAIVFIDLLLAITAFCQDEPNSIADQILDVSDANIDSVTNQYPALVLDCYKSGCGPCDEMDTALEEIARDLQGRVTFGKIDMKENLQTKQKYKIRSYPTLLLFDNGTLIDRLVGFSSREATKEEIESSFLLDNP